MFACVLTKISENTAVWERWQIKYELNCHISETQFFDVTNIYC